MSTTSGPDVLMVRFSRHDRTVVLHLAGDLDVETAPVLRQALAGIIEDQGNLAVRMDLGEMTLSTRPASRCWSGPDGNFARRAVTSPWPTSGRRR